MNRILGWKTQSYRTVTVFLLYTFKKGNISQVMNILWVWMIMMHTPKTIPVYADIIFESLNQIKTIQSTFSKFYISFILIPLIYSAGRLFCTTGLPTWLVMRLVLRRSTCCRSTRTSGKRLSTMPKASTTVGNGSQWWLSASSHYGIQCKLSKVLQDK